MRLLTLIPLIVLAATTIRAQENWPEYRGPTGDGQAPNADLPVEIDEKTHVRWKTPIHGKGWSSPVVWGQQIWLTTATPDGKVQSALCVDLDSGKVLRDMVIYENEKPDFCHPMNSYASCTPVIEEGRIYIHFGTYGTVCLDTKTGDRIWDRRDLKCNHFRGPASSPIVHDGMLVVAFDGFDYQYVVSLDTKTGKTVWKKDRNIKYGTTNGDLKKAYCTATVIEVDGQSQVICPSAMATIAYEPKTGEQLWMAYHGGMNASARPLFGQGLLFITNGMGGMVAVRPDGRGDVTKTHLAWNIKKSVAKKSSQIMVDGLLYMVSDNGIISCLEPKTAKPLWQERYGGEFAASPICAGGKIYFFGRTGKISVIEPGREYKLLAENQLGDGYMASPAIVGDKMILRSKTHLYCVSK
jgi:outer membrane protein assembly factor BamB